MTDPAREGCITGIDIVSCLGEGVDVFLRFAFRPHGEVDEERRLRGGDAGRVGAAAAAVAAATAAGDEKRSERHEKDW